MHREYLDARNLHPIRLLLRGGPSSGKSFIAKMCEADSPTLFSLIRPLRLFFGLRFVR